MFASQILNTTKKFLWSSRYLVAVYIPGLPPGMHSTPRRRHVHSTGTFSATKDQVSYKLVRMHTMENSIARSLSYVLSKPRGQSKSGEPLLHTFSLVFRVTMILSSKYCTACWRLTAADCSCQQKHMRFQSLHTQNVTYSCTTVLHYQYGTYCTTSSKYKYCHRRSVQAVKKTCRGACTRSQIAIRDMHGTAYFLF